MCRILRVYHFRINRNVSHKLCAAACVINRYRSSASHGLCGATAHHGTPDMERPVKYLTRQDGPRLALSKHK